MEDEERSEPDQMTTIACDPHGAAPAATVTFPQGLPGFPGSADYRLERLPGTAGLLKLRGSGENGPGFIVVPQPDGGGLLDGGDTAAACAAIGSDPADVLVLLVATAWRDARGLRLAVNRRAPVLVDSRRGLGYQVVLPRPDYDVRHALPV